MELLQSCIKPSIWYGQNSITLYFVPSWFRRFLYWYTTGLLFGTVEQSYVPVTITTITIKIASWLHYKLHHIKTRYMHNATLASVINSNVFQILFYREESIFKSVYWVQSKGKLNYYRPTNSEINGSRVHSMHVSHQVNALNSFYISTIFNHG